jgi:SAM-dependent methyltransferase
MSIFDDPGLFGRLWADHYDAPGGNPDPVPEVDFLAALAPGGRALELAIGTGRVALPLAGRGLTVEGVEASPEMVAKMRQKPGGETVPVAVADMADVPVEGPFDLVYLIFNTLFNLVSGERQADCFRNAARVLAPGGAFVIQAFVPDPADFDRDEQVQVRGVTEDAVHLRVHRYDREAQTFIRQAVTLRDGSVKLEPFAMHYLWPEQIDAMAEQAGLRLTERYGDYDKRPFTAGSRDHVSVYRLA